MATKQDMLKTMLRHIAVKDDYDDYYPEYDKSDYDDFDPDYAKLTEMAFRELERQGTIDFLLLREDMAREYWARIKKNDAREERARLRTEKLKALLDRLSDEEKELLGVKDKVIDDGDFDHTIWNDERDHGY